MTSQSIFIFDGYVCYHATGETSNKYYRNVGLLNTKEKLVVSATFNAINGFAQSSSPYFVFNGQGDARWCFVFWMAFHIQLS